jgi:hypothetical protein
VYTIEIFVSKRMTPLRDFGTHLKYPLPPASVDGTKYYIF